MASYVVQVIPGVIKCNQGPRLIWHRPIVFAFGNSLWNYSIWKIFRFDIYMLNRSSSWELLLRHAGGGPDGNRGISAITNASKTEHKRLVIVSFCTGIKRRGLCSALCISRRSTSRYFAHDFHSSFVRLYGVTRSLPMVFVTSWSPLYDALRALALCHKTRS